MNHTKKRIAATLSAAFITSAVLPAVVSAAQYTDYTVQKGDNLYRLALQFNTTVDEIVANNNIANRNLISVDQYLSIPTNTKDASSSSSSSSSNASTGSTSSTKYYYVLKNDTLSDIALKFGTTVSQLAVWNNISNVDFIREGALLKVGNTYTSGSTSTGSSSSSNSSTGSTSSASYYTVKKNDTLSEIAQMYGTTVTQLASWNNISDIHFIREGAVLQVRSGSSTSSNSSSNSSGTVASYQHKVVAGDNLYRLAITYGTTVSQLAAWNNISNVRLIYVGDVLQVSENTNARAIESYYTAPETAEDATPSVVETQVQTATSTPSVAETVVSTPSVAETVVSTPSLAEIQEETATSTPSLAETEVETQPEIQEEIATSTPSLAETQPEIQEEIAVSTPSEVETAPSAPSSELEVIQTASASDEISLATEETSVEARAISTVKTYKVTEDTTIFHLAALFNTPAASLISWNDLEDNQLTSGTEVIVAV